MVLTWILGYLGSVLAAAVPGTPTKASELIALPLSERCSLLGVVVDYSRRSTSDPTLFADPLPRSECGKRWTWVDGKPLIEVWVESKGRRMLPLFKPEEECSAQGVVLRRREQVQEMPKGYFAIRLRPGKPTGPDQTGIEFLLTMGIVGKRFAMSPCGAEQGQLLRGEGANWTIFETNRDGSPLDPKLQRTGRTAPTK
jgi:hypothetical protein